MRARSRSSIRPAAAAFRAVICAGALSGCVGMDFPVTEVEQASLADQSVRVIRITPENIFEYGTPSFTNRLENGSNPPRDPASYEYLIGPGDLLSVRVWSDPERSQTPGAIGAERALVVDGSGIVFYPFVGPLSVADRSAAQVRDMLAERLRSFIADPQVEVEVAAFNARSATITGVVGKPGSRQITNVPQRLLDLVIAAGVSDESDLTRVTLRRNDRRHLVNLAAFLRGEDLSQNPLVLADDLVIVPAIEDNSIFVFGEFGGDSGGGGGRIPLGQTRKSLTEVLAVSGGFDTVRADARGIFVFRREPGVKEGFDVYQFDLTSAGALVIANEFGMAPLDIVFVTRDPITRWNDTVNKLLSPVLTVLTGRAILDAAF